MNPSCTIFNIPVTIDSDGMVGRDSSIGIEGNPVISYFDNIFGNLKIIHCTNTSCVHHDMSITLDNDDTVGITISIAIGLMDIQ